MDNFVTPLIALIILLLLGAVIFLMRRRVHGDIAAGTTLAQFERNQTELRAQLTQLVTMQEAGRGELTRTLNEQLTNVTQNLSKNLTENTARTGESLTALSEQLTLIDKTQKELSALSGHVVGLQQILDNKQTRGVFGETRLNDLVRDVLPANSYAFQHTLSNKKRADCLIRLPNPPGPIVVDSKFPLEAYRAYCDAPSSDDKAQALKQLRANTLAHARDIATRYIIPGETADAALMFLPSESVFSELHLNTSDTFEQCRALRVYPVSPNTLWLTLNTVRAIMRDVEMNQKASQIQTLVRKMLEDVVRLDQRVDNLKKHFGNVNTDLEQIGTSTQKITSKGEQITTLELEQPNTPAQITPSTEP